tara:strand:- start:112 stop:1071 length:960 start_codon:yes stop_codon:yes gene_type:complete
MVVKLGIIGYRNHAKRLIDIIESKKGCKIKHIFHPKKKIIDERQTNEIKDLYDCDGIIIASPNNTHLRYLLKLKDYSGYIFCEKPPVVTKKELDVLKNISLYRKHKITFNFNSRHRIISFILKNVLQQEKKFGKIININLTSTHGYAFKKEYVNSWRANELHSVLDTVSIHYIDLFNSHLGVPDKIIYIPNNYSKKSKNYDTASISINYKNNIGVHILNSYSAPFIYEMSILTTNSHITIRDDKMTVYYPRSNFDENGFFKKPKKYREHRLDLKNDYNNSLKKSIDNFVMHIQKKKIFSLKEFSDSIKTNQIIIDLKND